ncbi:hypothetical protein CBS9595_000141 [Malassezia furfur]|nr:hypothetical protein CBS9595_000141 [Malassezia furfur]
MATPARSRVGGVPEATSTAVQVAVRIRPDSVEDTGRSVPRPLRTVVSQTSPTTLVVEPSALPSTVPPRDQRHAFTFDRVFAPHAQQHDVYTSCVEPLLHRFLDGYNTTIFAYGQTSSGKSYSMGTSEASEALSPDDALANTLDESIGIIPRAAVELFALLKEDAEYTLTTSFLELYNEDLIDLLADPDVDAPNQVQIRETRAGEIVWMGLRQRPAKCAADVVQLLQDGMMIRQTHETEMNTQSSRSHAIFSLTLTRRRPRQASRAASPEKVPATPSTPLASKRSSGLPLPGRGKSLARAATPTQLATPTRGAPTPRAAPPRRPSADEEVITTSKLHFVDLAGSERLKRTAASGDRVREGISINSGLHALGNVISTLSDPAKARRAMHIPYRDSKLTRLLQDSLGGNAHTLMLACVSSLEMNVNETLNTLHYAQRARHIRNTAERNQTEPGWGNVEYLQGQVLRLRKELDLVRSSNELILASPEQKAPSLFSSDAEQELLAWQEKYSALSRKNVQLTAELIHMDRQLAQRGANVPAGDFLASAEPVIVEYEKTVDSLEGQLNVLKASLASSEELLHERDQQLVHANHRLLHAETQLDALRSTVRDLQERLGETGKEGSASRRASNASLASPPHRTPPHRTPASPHSASRSFGGVLDYARDGTRQTSRRYHVPLLHAGADGEGEADADASCTSHAASLGAPDASTDHVLGLAGDESMLLPTQGADGTLEMIAATEDELRKLHLEWDSKEAGSPRRRTWREAGAPGLG